jgi:hypothetical protein
MRSIQRQTEARSERSKATNKVEEVETVREQAGELDGNEVDSNKAKVNEVNLELSRANETNPGKLNKSNQNAKQLARPQACENYEMKLEKSNASKRKLQKSKATNAAKEVEGKRFASSPKTSNGIRKMRRKPMIERYPKVKVRYRRSVYER